MQLVIAEKPSVARDLARVLGVRPAGQHCFEGERCVITWCVGHLVELEEPAAYDGRWKAWRLDTLPMLPDEFRLRAARHAAPQLRAVTRLLAERRFTSVVNACDAGREGELIFRYVHQYARGGPLTPAAQRADGGLLASGGPRANGGSLASGGPRANGGSLASGGPRANGGSLASGGPRANGGPSGRGEPQVLRLWISSLTDDAIRRGFAALRPGAQLDALADAARSRSEADWLVGMNATRAITARGRAAGHAALYSIGRVQTPTLAMLVGREHAIRAFVARPYWEVRGEFTAGGQRFTAGWRHGAIARLGSAAIAGEIVARDTAHRAAADPCGPRVERIRARTVREPPPLLFDLTSLQRTANRRFGFSAARTLEIAQALYERHKVLTYPRTDARHLSSDVARELPALFAALAQVPDYAAFAAPLVAQPPRPGRRIVDDTKVHDHHAIIPTGKPVRLDALDRDERRLFDLVARRFLAAFHPDAEFAITDVWIRVGAAVPGEPPPGFPGDDRPRTDGSHSAAGPSAAADVHVRDDRVPDTRGHASTAGPRGADGRGTDDGEPPILDRLPRPPDRYFARGRVRLSAGWQAVAGIDASAATRDRSSTGSTDRDDAAPPLPPLVEGQPLDGAFSAIAKHTTPPPRYTEATLLGAMESAGKAIDDEALRLAMKDCGLGTPATRAAIIETLLKRTYIERTRQQLAPTALGIALIDALPVASLASPELTGQWEARLARIARGEDSRASFMTDIARYVTDTVEAIRGSTPPAAPTTPTTPIGTCPRCSAPVVERPRAFACTGTCGFAMRTRVAGRAITAALAAVLLSHRRSQPLRGFRSKAGKPFAASLILDDSGELRFDFAPRPSSGRDHADHADSLDHEDSVERNRDTERNAPTERARYTGRNGSAERNRYAVSNGSAGGDRRRPRQRKGKGNGVAAGAPRARAAPSNLAVARGGNGGRARRSSSSAIDVLACPRCREGTLIAGARGWGCARWREGCRFVVWFETAGRRLTPAQLRDLVTRGKTRKATFVSAQGVELAARLVLDPALDGGSARLEPA